LLCFTGVAALRLPLLTVGIAHSCKSGELLWDLILFYKVFNGICAELNNQRADLKHIAHKFLLPIK